MNLSLNSITFLILVLFSVKLSSQIKYPRQYITAEINNKDIINIDGDINELVWNRVLWGDSFTEVYPDENTPPTELTKFKILYDQKYLYVSILALDSEPNSITSRLSRRDGFEGDRINVLIDSYHDLRTAFLFTVTAAGVRGDEIITNNGDDIDDSWNPIWTTKAKINSNELSGIGIAWNCPRNVKNQPKFLKKCIKNLEQKMKMIIYFMKINY